MFSRVQERGQATFSGGRATGVGCACVVGGRGRAGFRAPASGGDGVRSCRLSANRCALRGKPAGPLLCGSWEGDRQVFALGYGLSRFCALPGGWCRSGSWGGENQPVPSHAGVGGTSPDAASPDRRAPVRSSARDVRCSPRRPVDPHHRLDEDTARLFDGGNRCRRKRERSGPRTSFRRGGRWRPAGC